LEQQPEERHCAVPALKPVQQDFSDVLADDWSDVHMRDEWLVTATDDCDEGMDLRDVFKADEHCHDAGILQSALPHVRSILSFTFALHHIAVMWKQSPCACSPASFDDSPQ
jgi:hypothetical protein